MNALCLVALLGRLEARTWADRPPMDPPPPSFGWWEPEPMAWEEWGREAWMAWQRGYKERASQRRNLKRLIRRRLARIN